MSIFSADTVSPRPRPAVSPKPPAERRDARSRETAAKRACTGPLAGGVNVLNIICNAVLIYGCKLGAAGAAIGTSFSRLVWAVVSLVILHNKALPVYFENLLKFRIDWDIMKKILRIGLPAGIQSSL